MIDFRYHLVSLISVFLALAVGIALGAGPLQGSIGDQLTGQVEQLRTEKDELRAALDAETVVTGQQDAYLDALAPELLAGTLPRNVAVVALPGADEAVVDAAVVRLEQAGATVTAEVGIAPSWTDPGEATFRSSLVGNLAGYLDPAPGAEDSADRILGSALAQALTTPDAAEPAQVSENASLVLDVLTTGALVTVDAAPSAPADAVAVIAAPTAATGATPAPSTEAQALLDLVSALAAESQGIVVGGSAATASDAVSLVRSSDVAGRVATVDTITEPTGQISLPRALAGAIAGSVGHYGFAGSAGAVLPPAVVLPAVEPVQPEAEPAG